jgi:hypothetical protein
MEQIKAKILAHLIMNDGTVKDFTRAIYEVELCFRHLGSYPPAIMIKNQNVILCTEQLKY